MNIIEDRTPACHTQNMNTPIASGLASSSPLLRLPTEIRNRIYELVMMSKTPIERKRGTCALFIDTNSATRKRARAWHGQRQHVDTATSLSLALTCRQIYRETTGYYYTLNEFAFNLLDFADFSRSIRSSNLNRIAMVHCILPAECSLSQLVYLFRMAGLKKLHLELENSAPIAIDESRRMVEKMWQISKSLEEVHLAAWPWWSAEYHWTFSDGQLRCSVNKKSATCAMFR